MTDAPDPRDRLIASLLAARAEIIKGMLRDGFSSGLGARLAEIAAALAALREPISETTVSLAPYGGADQREDRQE